MSNVYAFKDYDKYLSLKAGYGLWLVILYFMHPYILMVSSLNMGKGGGRKEGLSVLKDMVYPSDFSLAIAIVATLPTLCFVYAWARRRPGAPRIVKSIWGNGVNVLSVSVLLNIAVTFIPLMIGVSPTIGVVGWIQIGLSILIIVYIKSSARVKDTFADFPEDHKE